jgi:hypothetical protein
LFDISPKNLLTGGVAFGNKAGKLPILTTAKCSSSSLPSLLLTLEFANKDFSTANFFLLVFFRLNLNVVLCRFIVAKTRYLVDVVNPENCFNK